MNKWKTIFLSDNGLSPMHQFRQIVDRYEGNKNFRTLRCLDQFMCMVLPQLTYRESSHDIECCLRAMQPKLYHMGIKGKTFRSTLAYANKNCNWILYCDFAQFLINMARNLYADDHFGL